MWHLPLALEGETLGKGTYGEVVKAKDKQTRRMFAAEFSLFVFFRDVTNRSCRQTRAIKIINKEKAGTAEGPKPAPTWLCAPLSQVHGDMAFLKQEIQNLIQLDHPHVMGSRLGDASALMLLHFRGPQALGVLQQPRPDFPGAGHGMCCTLQPEAIGEGKACPTRILGR